MQLKNFTNIPYELQLKSLEWRNSEEVCQYFQIKKISIAQHKKWLSSLKKEKPTTIAYMIYHNDEEVGVTYLQKIDHTNQCCDWGIYLRDTSQRNKGIGSKALTDMIQKAKKLQIKELYLEVLKTNARAIHLYEKNNFKITKTSKSGILRYFKSI